MQPAFAQSAPGGATAGVAAGDGSPGTLGGAIGPNPQFGIAIGSWLFYPSLFVGAIFNDNVYAASTNKVSSVGLRVRPSFAAINDSVVHKTTVYGTLDAQIYPGLQNASGISGLTASRTNPTDVQGRAGVTHVWSPTADWTVSFLGDFTRQAGFFGSGIVGPVNVFVPTNAMVRSTAQSLNQLTGSVSIEKKITDRSFVRATGTVQGILYDRQNEGNSFLPANVLVPTQNSGDRNLTYVGSLRGGYWVGPAIYIFAEGGADLRRYRKFLARYEWLSRDRRSRFGPNQPVQGRSLRRLSGAVQCSWLRKFADRRPGFRRAALLLSPAISDGQRLSRPDTWRGSNAEPQRDDVWHLAGICCGGPHHPGARTGRLCLFSILDRIWAWRLWAL